MADKLTPKKGNTIGKKGSKRMLRYCYSCGCQVESDGHMHMEKACDVCQVVKSIDQFLPHPTSIDKHQRTCKSCVKEEERQAVEQRKRWLAEREHKRLEEEERKARERLEQERERETKRQEALAWFTTQPDRVCVACHEQKKAIDFSARISDDYISMILYTRCRPCHEE